MLLANALLLMLLVVVRVVSMEVNCQINKSNDQLNGKGCKKSDKHINMMLLQNVEHCSTKPKVFLVLLMVVS